MTFLSKTKEVANSLFKSLWVYDEDNNIRKNHCIAYAATGFASAYLVFYSGSVCDRIKRLTNSDRE